MQKVKCIRKIRDAKGKITGYTIQNLTGETRTVDKDKLKEAVRNKQIDIVNMTLTSDNRLIDKNVKVVSDIGSITLSSNDRRAVEEIKQLCKTMSLPFDVSKIKRDVESGVPAITYSVSDMTFGVDTVDIYIKRINNKDWELSLDIETPAASIRNTNKDEWVADVKKMLALIPKRGQKPSVKTLMETATEFAPYSASLVEEAYVYTLFDYAEKTDRKSDLLKYISSVRKLLNTAGVHKVINQYIAKLEKSANPQEVNDIKEFPMTSDDVITIFALFGFDAYYFEDNPKISGSTLEQKVASAIKFNHGDLEPASVAITLDTARKYIKV